MSEAFTIRLAVAEDAAVLARHRVEMFREMGELPRASYEPLLAASRRYFSEAIPTGRYRGWVAVRASLSHEIVGGAGILVSERPPRPDRVAGGVSAGAEGYVLNVFVEEPWRRRGVAERLMREVMDWARGQGIDRLGLHASGAGRPLYEKLGFLPTNEMRLDGLAGRTGGPPEPGTDRTA